MLKAISKEIEKMKPKFKSQRDIDNSSEILFIIKHLLEKISTIKGDRGDPGQIGFGIMGEKGDKGDKGEKGDKPIIKKGIKGINGKNGRDGKDGKDANIEVFKAEVLSIAEHEVKIHEEKHDHNLIHDPKILGTIEVDESKIGKDKVLTYNGKKLVYETPKKGGKGELRGGIPSIGARYRIQTVTASTTIDPLNEMILIDASAGDITITLYSAVSQEGRRQFYKRIDSTLSNNVTFATIGGQTLDFETAYQLVNQGSGVELFSDNSNFLIKHT